MNRFSLNTVIATIIRILLGFLFLFAALDKIIDPAKFAEVVYNYRLAPVELLNIIAICVPWIEAIIGITLLIGVWVEVSAFILSGMTILFIIMIVSAILRGLNIECGCFSLDEAGSLVSWKRVIEDVAILIGGIYLFLNAMKKRADSESLS